MALAELLNFLADTAKDVVWFQSIDLTTKNTTPPPTGPTTPADDSLPGLPEGAFTPQTDRAVIAPDPANRTAITRAAPGLQVQAGFAKIADPAGQARFLLRFPNDWNGKLVVAGASGTRSEFNGDFAWSDFVIQQGYAYASQNKGVWNLFRSTAEDYLACRVHTPASAEQMWDTKNQGSDTYVHFYANDPQKQFTQWTDFMVRTTQLARDAVRAYYGSAPRRTYAVGTSNGGYQVRRALELAPEHFDGGVDWEGNFVDPDGPNLLIHLPPAIRNFPSYAASGFDPSSDAAQIIMAAGFPPDIVVDGKSLWGIYAAQFWEITLSQWQKRFDPAYDTYAAGPGNYNYLARSKSVRAGVAAIATTGKIKRPLVSVAGTMDVLLPIKLHARAYRDRVLAGREGGAEYRLYEIQNGNHIDAYRMMFPQLQLMQPHAQRAFELLVDHVENGAPLPPDQCVPRGGSISANPAEPGECMSLFSA